MSDLPVPSEPRSFLVDSEPYTERPIVKGDLIESERPTNRDLATGINHLNRRFDAHQDDDRKAFGSIRKDIVELKIALGLNAQGKRASGLSTPRQAFWRTVLASLSSMGGVLIVWKMLAVIWPAVAVAFTVLNKAIITGNFG